MSRRYSHILAVLAIFLFSLLQVQGQELSNPKNIIFLIGDGMGLSQISAADFEIAPLNLRRFKKLGLQTTTSANEYVTDSAAAGTALSTGFKTNKGYVGVDVDKKPLKNVFEYGKESGKTVGFVVTSTINHATPAAFSSHVESRNHYNEIAEQQVSGDIDVMIGGGLCNLVPQFMPGSRRKDNKNLLFELRRRMPVIQTIDAFRLLGVPKQLAAVFSSGHLPRASKRDYNLGELVDKAIRVLNQNEKGFFLMVEGSQIDLAGHKNDYAEVLSETVDFDTAIRVALDFAEKDGNTLVVVTSDHETGGLTLTDGSLTEKKAVYKFSTDQHSATMVPVFSYGPAADKFIGIYDNTHIGKTLIELVK